MHGIKLEGSPLSKISRLHPTPTPTPLIACIVPWFSFPVRAVKRKFNPQLRGVSSPSIPIAQELLVTS